MQKPEFWVLSNLAVLRSQARELKHGFLSSPLESASLPLKGWVYLWTLTVPNTDATLSRIRSCWTALTLNRKRDIPWFRGVRVFEPSPTGRWHVHIVTVERWNVHCLRSYALKYGFGRLNVKRVPPDKAGYVAKYLLKSRRLQESKGAQLAATFGFKGVRSDDIVTTCSWVDYVLKVTPQAPGQLCPWHLRQMQAKKIWQASLSDAPQTKLRPKMNLVKKEHIAQVVALLEKGEAVMIGEYRGHRVDEKEQAVKERPDLKEKRIIVAHSFETAAGEQIICAEWMPSGTRKEDVKPALQKGDFCILVVGSLSFKGGSRQGSPRRWELLSKLV